MDEGVTSSKQDVMSIALCPPNLVSVYAVEIAE